MKKILSTIVIVATASAAFAQGFVNAAPTASFITGQTNSSISPLFGGSGLGGTFASTPSGLTTLNPIYYALLYQPMAGVGVIATDKNVWDGGWTATGITYSNSATAGRLVQVGTQNTVPWANGISNSIVLVGWSSSLGTTWAQVASNAVTAVGSGNNWTAPGFFGESNFGFMQGSALLPGAALFAASNGANGLPIFSLATQLYAVPVPEPTTMVLVGLGGLSLLLFRRRK